MVKDAIGIIDLGLEGFGVAKKLAENFKHENIVYVTDLAYDSHLNISDNEIAEIVRRNIGILFKHNPKLIVVVSPLIVERAAAVILDLLIPSVNIIETLIAYANTKYEYKNMLLLGKNSLLEANLFQKNLRCSHLYQLPSDELDAVVKERMTKTSRSFNAVCECLKAINKKPVDLVIAATPSLTELKTEIKEYLQFEELTNLGTIYVERLNACELTHLNMQGRGGFFVCSNLSKKEFRALPETKACKFKYQQTETKKQG